MKRDFQFLFDEYQFEFVNSIEEEESEFVTIIQNDEILLRFIFDRADFFLDISKKGNHNEWEEFFNVLDNLYKKKVIKEEIKVVNKKNRIKSLLKKYLPFILRNLDQVK